MNMSDLEGVKTKVCSKCKIEKPVDVFSKDKSRKDGLSHRCKECKKEYNKEYYKANYNKLKESQKEYKKVNFKKIRDRNRKYDREYRNSNSEKIKEYRNSNSEKIKEFNREYYKTNSDKFKERRNSNFEKLKEYGKQYRKANPDKRNAIRAKRNAKKLQATPPWLTKGHLSDIRMYYTESKALEKATGIKHHVDHIVPLQGKNVCGLHVPWNLQVLTASENSAKGNHHPDEWEDT